jgi:hypothetical protein
MTFKFDLGQAVVVKVSNEAGQVHGRAEYLASEPSYYVIYKSADGRAIDSWWPESALTAG